MNDKAFENKVNRDVDNAKKDLATLKDDGIAGVSRMFDQLTGDATKMVAVKVKTFNKAFEKSLSQYNEKVQDLADRVPGGFAKKAAGYPWVTVTMSLALGLLLGMLLKPGRQQPAG